MDCGEIRWNVKFRTFGIFLHSIIFKFIRHFGGAHNNFWFVNPLARAFKTDFFVTERESLKHNNSAVPIQVNRNSNQYVNVKRKQHHRKNTEVLVAATAGHVRNSKLPGGQTVISPKTLFTTWKGEKLPQVTQLTSFSNFIASYRSRWLLQYRIVQQISTATISL